MLCIMPQSCFDFAQNFASRFPKLERLKLTEPLFLAGLGDETDTNPLARTTNLDNSLLVPRALHILALKCSAGPEVDLEFINEDPELTDRVDALIVPLLDQWLTSWINPTSPKVRRVIFNTSAHGLTATAYRWDEHENWGYDLSLGPSTYAA